MQRCLSWKNECNQTPKMSDFVEAYLSYILCMLTMHNNPLILKYFCIFIDLFLTFAIQ